MRMQRDVPSVLKGICMRSFVVVCDLPPSPIGEIPHEDVKVSKAESRDFESDFERPVGELYGSPLFSGLPWSFWMSLWVVARHSPLRAAPGLRSCELIPLLHAIRAPKFRRRNSQRGLVGKGGFGEDYVDERPRRRTSDCSQSAIVPTRPLDTI